VSPAGETTLLADVAMRESLPDRASVLELCGPAHAGIAAARAHRATLTVVDVARRTMLRTIVSGMLHRVRVRARRGQLFDPVPGERFDLILAVLSRERDRSRAGGAREMLDNISAGAAPHLRVGGALLVAHSGIWDPGATLAVCVANGLRAEVAARRAVRVTPDRRTALDELGIPRRSQSGEEAIFVVRAQRT
jgi:release factor glutamine methyltransferase